MANTDQFTLEISGGGLPGAGSGENLSVTTSGTQLGLQEQMVGPLLALDGVELTINEVSAGTTNLADYTRSWICIDEANNDAEVASGTNFPATFTMPTPEPKDGSSVVCTIRNELYAAPSLIVEKWLPNGRKDSGDQFTLNVTQGATTVATATTQGTNNAPSQQAELSQATAGVTYTVSEVAAGTTVLNNYTTRYECDNYQSGGQNLSGVGRSFNITLAEGDDIVCTFINTPLPEVYLSKVALPATGTPVLLGQLLTYTLTAQVIHGPTLSPVVLDDQLGEGLTFVEVTSPGAFTYNPATRRFTMPAGQPGGTYSVSYTARVDSDATVSVNNSVTGTGGGGLTDPNCAEGASCTTTHPIPITASLVLGKRLPNGRLTGTDQFNLTIAQGGITQATVTTTGSTNAPAQQASVDSVEIGVPYTLTETASGTTVLGDYASRYECVNSKPGGQAPADVGTSFNVILAADDDLVCTFINSVPPTVEVYKGASPFKGVTVQPGQLIGYTLYTQVTNGPTLSPVVLTDELGPGLTFVRIEALREYSYDPDAGTFTLPAGQPSGIYPVTYIARVDADTDVVLVNNNVSGEGGGDPLNPTQPTCAPNACTTSHPVEHVTPAATVSKSADPVSGTTVEPNQTISYTLSVHVTNGPTVSPIVLRDQLGAGLTFGTVTSEGAFSYDPSIGAFNLPAGQATGTHSVTYTATVDTDASGSVGNFVGGAMAGNVL